MRVDPGLLTPGLTSVTLLADVPVDFSPYQAVLLDLDGTIYHEDHALPGAVRLVERLARERRPFAALTNSNTSPQRISQRLAKMGIAIPPANICSAAAVACEQIVSTFGPPANPRPRVFNLAGEGVREMMDGQVDWVNDSGEPCHAVIVGAPVSNYASHERQRIALYLIRRGAKIIGICADRLYPSKRGLEYGAGAHTWMIAYAANAEPVFTGKPQRVFFETPCKHLGVSPDRTILIGDNIEADILGAKALGMRTILTLTGVTRRRDLLKLAAEQQPDMVVEDLTEL